MAIRKIVPTVTISLLILVFATLRSWMFFSVNLLAFSGIVALLLLIFGGRYVVWSRRALTSSILLFIAVLVYSAHGNLNGIVAAISGIMPVIIFLFFREDVKIRFLQVFNKAFGIVAAVSLFFWLLFLLHVPLPHYSMTFGENYFFDNYFFFIRFTGGEVLWQFPRYTSIFIEPGELACYYILLLFLDKFRMKWYNIVYLIGLVLTFSIAGLLLLAVALVPIFINKQTHKGNRIIIGFLMLLFIGGIYYAINSNQNSAVYELIGSRLQYDEDQGRMTGYDRSTLEFDDYWNNRFWDSGNVLWGKGKDAFLGVDMRVFVVRYGLISLLAYVIFLLSCILPRRSYDSIWYFLLFVLIFYRGYSLLFYPGIIILLISGLDYLYYGRGKSIQLWPN